MSKSNFKLIPVGEINQMIQDKRHIGNTITGATDEMDMSFVDNVINLFK